MWFSLAKADIMPPAVTEVAERVDSLNSFLVIASLIACVLLIGAMTYFVIKYRRRHNNEKTPYITHNMTLEFLWSFIPLLIFLVCFAWGWVVYHDERTPPEDSLEIHVIGYQWAWDFLYKSGKKSVNEFYAPVNTPVRLVMTSRDVLHSFFVPSFRIKQDVVPGMYTQIWFDAKKEGSYHIFCTEYCGAAHSNMIGKLNVVSMEAYEAWLAGEELGEGGGEELSLPEIGQKLYRNNACVACHSTDGSVVVGPSFKGLFGSQRNFADGSQAVADEAYIRESILNPNAKVVSGFTPGQMPPMQGLLSEEEVLALIEFIKSLK